MNTVVTLNFYGVSASVSLEDPDLVSWLKFDFSFFLGDLPQKPDVTIVANVSVPPFNRIPEVAESMRSSEFVCYDSGALRYVDYNKRLLVIFDTEKETAELFSEDLNLLYEKLYLLILSRSGEILDTKNIHRIHAFGFSFKDQAALFLMPSGGGKSTLALSLLAYPGISLLSEDTPLMTARGDILPFPLRLGVSEAQIPPEIDPSLVRSFSREKWGLKYLLHIDHYRGKLRTTPAPLRFIFTAKWLNSDTPRYERMSRLRTLRVLFRDCVVGLGLPQVIEYFLTARPGDLLKKALIATRRLRTVLPLPFKTKGYTIFLSKNYTANAELLLSILEKEQLR